MWDVKSFIKNKLYDCAYIISKEHFSKYSWQSVSYGDKDPDKKYLLIQKEHKIAGIMEDYVNFLLVIDYALSRGMIPVIDRLNHPAIFQQDETEQGRINGWEKWFEQPLKGIGVEYVEGGAKNVTICSHWLTFCILEVMSEDAERFMNMLVSSDPSKKHYADHLKWVAQNYIRFNERTKRQLDNSAEKLFVNNEKVLGISIREETILRGEPTGKGINSGIYEKVREFMAKSGCTKLFIASEFAERIDIFKREFGEENILFLERKRPYNREDPMEKEILELSKDFTDENCRKIIDLQAKVFGEKEERWLSYLAEIYCLSLCDSAMLQISSGNIAALLMKEKEYDKVAILNS